MFSEIKNDKYYSLMVLLATEQLSNKDLDIAKVQLNDLDIIKFYEIALEHDMESIIYPNLKLLNYKIIPQFWHDKYNSTKSRIAFMIDKLKEVAQRFEDKAIPIIALKNGGIAMEILDDYGKSPMGDIDTLVNKKDFLVAHKMLIEMGFKFEFRSEFEFEDIEKAFQDGGTEYYFKGKENEEELWFEMSWRPIAGRWIRLDKEPKSEQLFEKSSYIKNTKVRILSPEDNLLQVSIHTAKHSYVRDPGFRLHLDVERIVKYYQIDWKIFMNKVDEVGTKTAIYYSLHIAKELFNTPIPNKVLDKLRPFFIKKWIIDKLLKRAKLLHPLEEKFTKIEFVIFQIMLYDQMWDIFRVIYPSSYWMKKKYGFKSTFLMPYFIVLRVLDLIGFRKSK
jgi:hypothetical protein